MIYFCKRSTTSWSQILYYENSLAVTWVQPAMHLRPDRQSGIVVRQCLIRSVATESRETLTSLSDSGLCLMRLAHAGFLWDTRRCPTVTSKSVRYNSDWSDQCRATVSVRPQWSCARGTVEQHNPGLIYSTTYINIVPDRGSTASRFTSGRHAGRRRLHVLAVSTTHRLVVLLPRLLVRLLLLLLLLLLLGGGHAILHDGVGGCLQRSRQLVQPCVFTAVHLVARLLLACCNGTDVGRYSWDSVNWLSVIS